MKRLKVVQVVAKGCGLRVADVSPRVESIFPRGYGPIATQFDGMKKVWLPNKDTAWDLCDVLSVGNETNPAEQTLNVMMPLPAEGGGAGRLRTTGTVLLSSTIPYDESHGIAPELLHDLCMFNKLHEAPLVDGLHRRYKQDLIYTNIGNNLLLSINPCKHLDIYDTISPYLTANIAENKDRSTESLQPHVYALANHALSEKVQSASKRTANQSIMVCGESGSGKTEASKYAMHFLLQADKEHQRHLNASTVGSLNTAFGGLTTSAAGAKGKVGASVGKGSASDTAVLSSVLGPSSVIFESFGNARTKHNGNSSRFGKYTKFQYSADHRLISAYTETFLLEQTRLVTVGEGEQNYHIFYALLNTKTEASRLRLTAPGSFKILCDSKGQHNSGSTGAGAGLPSAADDLQRSLGDVSASLKAVGVTEDELFEIWSLLGALLHLGNIECKSIVDESKPQADENYEQVELISPTMPLSELCYLLGVSSLTFEARVLTQRVQVGNRDSIHVKQLKATDVAHNILALIKWTYSTLFAYLIRKLNHAHTSTVRAAEVRPTSFVGILDIFGFEVLGVNSFEQLCINYTNECLQQLFYQHVFDREQALYAEEGLTWSTVAYNSNQAVIDLIAKRPTGLLNALEELSVLNRGQQDEGSLLAAYNATHATNPLYERPRFGANTSKLFTVKHYAGPVTYSVTGFLEKNNYALQEDLLTLMMCSSNAFIQNAIVAVGTGAHPSAENAGQPGYVPEVTADKVVQTSQAADLSEAHDGGAEAPLGSPASQPKRRSNMRRGSVLAMTPNPLSAAAGAGADAGKKLATTTSVSAQFRFQLEELLLTLQGTQPHYVMCYKPNTTGLPNALDRVLLSEQLRYSGALEVVRIRQKGFPVSLSFEEFATLYRPLLEARAKEQAQAQAQQAAAGAKGKGGAAVKAAAATVPELSAKELALRYLNEQFASEDGEFQVGKNRIFLRTPAVKVLEEAKATVTTHTLSKFQALARKHLAQRRFKTMRGMAIVVQAKVRMFLKRRQFRQQIDSKVEERLRSQRMAAQRNQDINNYEQRVQALHNACTAAEFTKVRDMLIKNPEDYYVVNWCRNNCTVLQSAILGGSLQLIQYLKPYPEELHYPDAEGNTAVHYAAKSAAPDRTEILRYFQFVIEPAYLKDIQNVSASKSGQKYATVRPLQSKVQVPTLPSHMQEGKAGAEDSTASVGASARVSSLQLVKKNLEADSRLAVAGTAPGAVLKAGWLHKRGFKTASMWRKRWAVLTTEALSYYHTEKDATPRDSLPLRHKDCISVRPSEVRANAFDIIMAEGAETAGKAREMVTMLAENEKDMVEWMNLLTAVAGTDATPLRLTAVRTISPVLNEGFFSSRNNSYETALHALCGVSHTETGSGSGQGSSPTGSTATSAQAAAHAKIELEKTLPATAAWLIHRSCPVNSFNSKGQSPLFIAIENGRFHLGLVLLRYGATVPVNCPGKAKFLTFCDEEDSREKVIAALQFQPRPARLRNFHYLGIEVLSQYIGSLTSFLNQEEPGAYFITMSVFSAAHTALCPTQYSQCPLIRVIPKAPSTTSTGAINISRTGTDSQLILWYHQYHLPLPLESVPDGAYIVVELSRAGASSVEPQSTPSQVGRESQSQGSHRQSVAKSGHGASGGGGATITSLAWFTLKIDKEALNTSVLTIPFLKSPMIRQPVAQTTTTADAHQGNMHSVAMVETTIFRRNGKEAW